MAKNEKSISDIVCDHLKKQKLTAIPVQTLNEDAESTRYFGGGLKEFVAAAKILGAKALFVETLYLEDDEFFYDSGMDDEEYMETFGSDNGYCRCGCGCECGCSCGCGDDCECGPDCECGCNKDKKKGKKSSKKSEPEDKDPVWVEPEDLDGLDLSLLKPDIADYMRRIGEACGVRLTVPGVDHLEVEIFSDWYDEFAQMVDEASEEIEMNPAACLEKIQRSYEQVEAEARAAVAAKDNSVKKIAAHPPKKAAGATSKKKK